MTLPLAWKVNVKVSSDQTEIVVNSVSPQKKVYPEVSILIRESSWKSYGILWFLNSFLWISMESYAYSISH